LGAVAGLSTVDVAIAEPRLRAFVARLWSQAAATLPVPVRDEAPVYGARLLERFANPALRHRLLQIAADGSRKLPQRLIGTLIDARRTGAPHDAPVLAVASWIRFCEGHDDAGRELPLDDPLSGALRDAARTAGEARATVRAVFALDAAFGEAAADGVLVDAIADALGALRARGALGALAADGRCVALSSPASRN
jgi:fructuronate reductase